ncbi:hypothetical protein ABBQ38_012772 [Trebouxia sp. C0009 RCD-2024]
MSSMQTCLLKRNTQKRSILLTVATNVLQDCLPVVTILFRIQGKDLADLLYAATDRDLRGCKLLQIAMMALQLQLQAMGVQRIFLDAAGERAKSVWCALGFSVIAESQYQVLAYQYCLVVNDLNITARSLKLVPDKATLLAQLGVISGKVYKDILSLKSDRTLTYRMRNKRAPKASKHPGQPHAHNNQPAREKRPRQATVRMEESDAKLPRLRTSLKRKKRS